MMCRELSARRRDSLSRHSPTPYRECGGKHYGTLANCAPAKFIPKALLNASPDKALAAKEARSISS